MEQENNNDRLDRFLHRAFDDFSANPSDGLWDKINAGLAPEAPPAKVVPLIRPWHVAASIAVVVSLFLMQHYYFASKIEDLRQEMQNTASTPSLAPSSAGQSDQAATATRPTTTLASPSEISVQNSTPIELISTPVSGNAVLPRQSNHTTTIKKNSGVDPLSTQQAQPLQTAPEPPMAGLNNKNTENTIPQPDASTAKNISNTNQKSPINLLGLLPLNRLPQDIHTQYPIPQVTFAGSPYITKVNRFNQLALNIHATPGIIHTKINAPEPPPGGGPGGPGPGNDNIFSDKEQTGKTMLVGIGLEKQLNKHWSMVSGVDYLSHTIQQNIAAPLKFKDRIHGPGGGQGIDEHDFNYYVGTGGGSYLVDVELRAVDSTQTIDEDEEVNLEISTTNKAAYLSIPLAMKYRLTWKKWSAYVVAGTRLNYLLKSSEGVDQFACDNDRFEFRGQPKLEKKAAEIRKVSSDLMVSAGLEYRIQNIGLTVAPTFNKPLIKPIKDDRVSVSACWAGVNVGMQYYF